MKIITFTINQWDSIGDEGAIQIAEPLRTNTNLTDLNLKVLPILHKSIPTNIKGISPFPSIVQRNWQ